MAFRKDKTTAAQTAANVAGSIVAAGVTGADSAKQAAYDVVLIFGELFAEMAPVVDADNEVFAAAEAAAPAPAAARERKTGGGQRRSGGGGGGGNKSITLDQALGLELTGKGVFAGETLGDVLALTATQCDENFGYGDGERDGRDYIAWLASDRNKNTYTQDRARVIADAEGISY